jgi:mannose PTS system EIIA component
LIDRLNEVIIQNYYATEFMTTRILIIAHAPLASALRACVLHVYPEVSESVTGLDIAPDVAVEHMRQSIGAQIEQWGSDPVLILTDVFGATPCNIAQRVSDGQRVKLVTGVNLPMLLRTVNYRHEALDILAARAVAGGTQCIMQVAVTAPQNQNRSNHDQTNHHHHQ